MGLYEVLWGYRGFYGVIGGEYEVIGGFMGLYEVLKRSITINYFRHILSNFRHSYESIYFIYILFIIHLYNNLLLNNFLLYNIAL